MIYFNNNVSFNTQPPEGGWFKPPYQQMGYKVSTHSRLKAAGVLIPLPCNRFIVSTHSRLKAAGQWRDEILKKIGVSTHSRLKAAG